MTHPSDDGLARFARGDLPADRLVEIAQHVESCAECVRRTDVDRVARDLAAATDPRRHVTSLHVDADFAAYLDGKLAERDRQAFEQHLAACETCTHEMEDLRSWASSLDGRPRPRRLWYAAAAAAVVAAVVVLLLRSPQPPVSPSRPRSVRVEAPIAPESPRGYGRAEWDRLAGEALRTGRVERAAPFTGRRGAEQNRGGVVEPRSGAGLAPTSVVIDEVRPELRWRVAPGESYRVVISLDDEIVVESGVVARPPWRCSRTLLRGRVYRWQVRVAGHNGERIEPAPPDPPALFKVASQRDHDDIAAASREFPGDHLLLGLLYARAGMDDDARAHLRRYAADVRTKTSESLVESLSSPR